MDQLLIFDIIAIDYLFIHSLNVFLHLLKIQCSSYILTTELNPVDMDMIGQWFFPVLESWA